MTYIQFNMLEKGRGGSLKLADNLINGILFLRLSNLSGEDGISWDHILLRFNS